MNPSTRKKILIGAAGAVGLVVVAAVAAPAFIDVNAYKPTIAAEVKKATGRDILLDGPISLSILPTPRVSLSGVKFFNVAGSKNPHMVEVKSVTVKPSVLALLGGNIEVSEVTIVEPKIVLEISPEGKPNWEFAPSIAEAKPATPKPGGGRPLSLGRMTIENGTLIFSDSKAGLSLVADKADITASVGSPEGPFSLNGSANLNGAPLKIDLAVGGKGADGHAMDVNFQAGGGKLTFKGKLSELGPNARLVGQATAGAESMAEFVSTLIGLTGDAPPPPSPLFAGKFSFEGAVDVSQTAIAAKDFKVALGQDTGSGTVAVTLKPKLSVEARLNVPKVDLDKWLGAATAKPAPAAPPKSNSPPAAARPPAVAPAPAAPAAAATSALPPDLTVKAAITVGEAIYNKAPIKNLAVELDIRGGAIAVPRLTATLPGDMVLDAKSTMSGDPARPQVSGEFSLNGPKLRDTLAWMKVDTASLPTGKFARISVKGRMASSGNSVQVTNAVYELDDIKGSGGVTVTLSVPLQVVANVELDTIDVDAYMPKPAAGQKLAPAAAAPAPGPQTAGGPSIGLKARINRLIYNKETVGGVEVDIAMQGTTLRLNDIKVGNLAGARLALRGTVANYASALPAPDLAFNFEAPDASRVAKLVGASAPADLKQVSLQGGIAGTVEQLTFRDLALNAMGYSVRANGQLALPGASKGAPQSATYKGNLSINGQAVDGTIEARFAGRPNITADLKAGTFDVSKITGGAAAQPAGARPAAGGAAKPIDTSGMRGLDASVKFVAATLVSPPIRMTNADIAITLKDGLLTISHVKGGLFGGSLNMAGTVDGRQPALAVDLKGDANNIHIGEMLRSTSGTNQFGSAVKVTIDGKLSATGFTFKGSGTTADQIKASLNGGTALSGHVFAGADRALTTIGSAATGAVGGVIDNTVGTLLGGVTGNRQGVGVGNLLNAISLVLNRFVNHDSPISGRLEIANGVVSDRGLAIQGSKCVANISTRTNLGASTTDTTVNFVISEDSSAPYLITTARGPTSSPSLNVVRGTAKDPPGMLSTLPGIGGNTQPGTTAPSNQPSRSPIPNLPNIFGR